MDPKRVYDLMQLDREDYQVLSSDEQRRLCIDMDTLIAIVNRRDKNEIMSVTGLPADQIREEQMKGLLGNLSWQMAMLLRYATPTRIYEATPYLETVLATNASVKPGLIDPAPLIYLGASLSKTPEAYGRALANLNKGIGAASSQVRSMLYGQATRSKLLRRMGRIPEAEEDEKAIRFWIRFHPYAMPPSEFKGLISEEGEGENHILDHPDMARFGEGVTELSLPGGLFGSMMIHTS